MTLLLSMLLLSAPAGEPSARQVAIDFGVQLCEPRGNDTLKGISVGAAVGALETSYGPGYSEFASSFLEPSGAEPTRTAFPDTCNGAPECEDPLPGEYAAWTCRYAPQQAFSVASQSDHVPLGAWCEGAAGDGVGEVLVAKVNLNTPVVIWGGYGKNDEVFKKNGRPERVAVYILEARKNVSGGAGGWKYLDVGVAARHEVTLEDLNGYQSLPLPAYSARGGSSDLGFVAIEILSVYKGTNYPDTCISHVRNVNSEGG